MLIVSDECAFNMIHWVPETREQQNTHIHTLYAVHRCLDVDVYIILMEMEMPKPNEINSRNVIFDEEKP